MEPEGIERVPKHLPVLLLTGEDDPVSSSGAQVRALEKLMRDAGLDVTAKYYPGARHEVLNEQLGTKTMEHPEQGILRIYHFQSVPTSHPDLRLTQFAPADDATRAAFAALCHTAA